VLELLGWAANRRESGGLPGSSSGLARPKKPEGPAGQAVDRNKCTLRASSSSGAKRKEEDRGVTERQAHGSQPCESGPGRRQGPR